MELNIQLSVKIIDRYLNSEAGINIPQEVRYNKKEQPLIYSGGAILEQKRAFRLLHQTLKQFQEEAINGLKDLTEKKQKAVIIDRRKSALNVLCEGSFFPEDRKRYALKVCQKVDRIYKPNMK